MKDEQKLDAELYLQQFPNAEKHVYTGEEKQPEWYEVQGQQAAGQAAPQGMPQGGMAQQFGLGNVPQAQLAMAPARSQMQPLQQTTQQAVIPGATPISQMAG